MKADPYHHSRFLGYISEVYPAFCKLRFPNKKLLQTFYHSGEEYKGGVVGSYVIIAGEKFGFLARISNIYLPENDQKDYLKNPKGNNFHPVANLELLVSFDYMTRNVDKGLADYPTIGAKVFACSSEDLAEIVKGNAEEDKSFLIGHLADNENAKLNISINDLLGRHLAIIGSTGGGKSFSLAKITEEFANNGGKLILLDATGEFEPFRKHKKVESVSFSKDKSSVFFDYSKLTLTDYHAMFTPAGQVQAPKLQEAIKSLRLLDSLKRKASLSELEKRVLSYKHNSLDILEKAFKPRNDYIAAYRENNIDDTTNTSFEILSLAHQIYYECVYPNDFDKPNNFGKISERDQGNVNSLIIRVSSIVGNVYFSSVFNFNNKKSSSLDICSVIEKFIENKDKNVLHISLKEVPDEWNIREILVNSIGRYLLNKARSEEFKENPLVIALDEAHQFLNKKIFDEYSLVTPLDSFDKIAKECRKFGLFTIISTQMPRDIPSGVLSQMGAFIVHRMINEKDRQAIENATSDASRTALSFLPVLTKGEAILTGVEFPMPVIIKINKPTIEPNSKTPKIIFSNNSIKQDS